MMLSVSGISVMLVFMGLCSWLGVFITMSRLRVSDRLVRVVGPPRLLSPFLGLGAWQKGGHSVWPLMAVRGYWFGMFQLALAPFMPGSGSVELADLMVGLGAVFLVAAPMALVLERLAIARWSEVN